MNINLNIQPKTKIRIGRHDFQTIDSVQPGTTLWCDSGVLWVTQPGDCKDYVLTPGQKMTVTKRGKLVIEAMRDGDFRVL